MSSWDQPPAPRGDASCTDATAAAGGAAGEFVTPGVGGSAPRGPLRPGQFDEVQTLHRYDAPPELAPYVDWIWAVEWDLPAATRRDAPVLSHPCIHATLEGPAGRRHGEELPAALVHGVVSRRFEMRLTETGWVVGLRFRPGAHSALTGVDAATLTDRVVRLEDAPAADALRDAVAAPDREGRVAALVAWWSARLPSVVDATYEVVRALVTDVETDRGLQSVEALAERHGLTVRTVQRLVRWYVGVPPSWLIRRYRLQDALATMQADPGVDLAELAVGLGWYDQAHFTRDFRAAVGHPPARYLRRVDDDEAWT